MAELGVLLVGPRAAQLSTELFGTAQVSWATVQAAADDVLTLTEGWHQVLAVGWADEPTLVPILRQLVPVRDVCVLLGGDPRPLEPGPVQSNHTVVASLLRQHQLSAVYTSRDPAQVLVMAAEVIRRTVLAPQPPKRPLDLGLGIGRSVGHPGMTVMADGPVVFRRLAVVPIGQASGLGRLLVLCAVVHALEAWCDADPVLDSRGRGDEERLARDRLPPVKVHEWLEERIRADLSEIQLDGSEPLVEQIDRVLRPVATEVERLCGAIGEAERARLSPLRAFTACGIRRTVEALDVELKKIEGGYPSDRLRDLARLLEGTAPADSVERGLPITAWREVFGDLSSEVRPSGTVGYRQARALVHERLDAFRKRYAATVADHVKVLVERARDPGAPASSIELRLLKSRAERVNHVLTGVVESMRDQIVAEAVSALRTDRIVRWVAADPSALAERVIGTLGGFDVAGQARRVVRGLLSQASVGRMGDRAFDIALDQLSEAVAATPDQINAPPYYDVLHALVRDLRPEDLRAEIAASAADRVQLRLQSPLEGAAEVWFAKTGMDVVVAPHQSTCALCEGDDPHVGVRHGPRSRTELTEHQVADLMLPPPGGDTHQGLVQVARAASAVLLSVIIGMTPIRRSGPDGYELQPPQLGDWQPPIAATYRFSEDEGRLATLERELRQRLAALPAEGRAVTVVRHLAELATLGPTPTLLGQLGLIGRLEALGPGPVKALLSDAANHAISIMLDASHTSEVTEWVRTPRRRRLLDLGAFVEGA